MKFIKAGLSHLTGSAGMLLVFCLAGIPFFLVGLFEVVKTYQMLDKYSPAQGIVVENVWTAFGDGGAAYIPRVEYRAEDGTLQRFSDGIGSDPPDYQVGAQVAVLYDSQGVQPARINSWKRIWFAPLFIMGIGLLPGLAGLIGVWVIRPKGQAG